MCVKHWYTTRQQKGIHNFLPNKCICTFIAQKLYKVYLIHDYKLQIWLHARFTLIQMKEACAKPFDFFISSPQFSLTNFCRVIHIVQNMDSTWLCLKDLRGKMLMPPQ